jgi:hypothetical protein
VLGLAHDSVIVGALKAAEEAETAAEAESSEGSEGQQWIKGFLRKKKQV